MYLYLATWQEVCLLANLTTTQVSVYFGKKNPYYNIGQWFSGKKKTLISCLASNISTGDFNCLICQ